MNNKRQPMTISPGLNASIDKQRAIDIVSQVDDYLGTDVHKGRIDIDKKLWRAITKLKNETETEMQKSVSARMLITEAIVDLFDKYEGGKGKYPLIAGVDEFDWNK